MKGGNFQSESKRQGEMFEAQAAIFLKSLGFQLSGKRTLDKIGCEVDELALAPNGERVYFEFKGSYRGKVPGMRRTDTVKKGLLTGFLLQYYILTSHLPVKGSALTMVNRSVELGAVAGVLEINTEKAQQVLEDRFVQKEPHEEDHYPRW